MNGFASTTVDFGLVVSDIDRSVRFYKDAVGLMEVEGFDVPTEMGGDSGLSDYKSFHVRILKVADSENATGVKLMQFKDAPGKTVDNAFIHSSYGIRYLTFYVSDMDVAVERAKRAGYPPIVKGPIPLPAGFTEGVYLALLRDPDGNLLELVGPRGK